MKLCRIIILLLLGGSACLSVAAERQPDAVVQKLYDQVVARHPLGIPKGRDRAVIWPFLSKRLIRTLEAAQSCEADYDRQHAGHLNKPEFRWLESGLFSGENEQALPAKAIVERTEPQKDGSFRVYVKLRYNADGQAASSTPFEWQVAVTVIPEEKRFVIDDILLFEDDSTEIKSRLSDFFVGCAGTHWIGHNAGIRLFLTTDF